MRSDTAILMSYGHSYLRCSSNILAVLSVHQGLRLCRYLILINMSCRLYINHYITSLTMLTYWDVYLVVLLFQVHWRRIHQNWGILIMRLIFFIVLHQQSLRINSTILDYISCSSIIFVKFSQIIGKLYWVFWAGPWNYGRNINTARVSRWYNLFFSWIILLCCQ